MNMKKFWALMLSLAMALSLAALSLIHISYLLDHETMGRDAFLAVVEPGAAD